MISRDKITEIFCMADDFCKLYDSFIKANGLAPKRDKSKRKYHRYLLSAARRAIDRISLLRSKMKTSLRADLVVQELIESFLISL